MILIYKGIAGLLSGVLIFYTYPRHLNGFQAFFLSVIIYAIVSILMTDIAKRANPTVSISIYVITKGLMTYYFTLYLTILTLYVFLST